MIWALLLLVAQEPEIDCDKDETQIALNHCAGKEFEAADAALNVQWKQTYARLQERDADYDKDRSSNDKSEGDATCEAEGAGYRGGSMQPLVIWQCRTKITVARTADLAQLIEEY